MVSQAGRCDDAFALVEHMREATPRVLLDATTFNTLLSACVRSGQVREGVQYAAGKRETPSHKPQPPPRGRG